MNLATPVPSRSEMELARQEIARLRAQNAELLEALKEVLSVNVGNTHLDRDKWFMRHLMHIYGTPLPKWVDKADAAIRRAEEGK